MSRRNPDDVARHPTMLPVIRDMTDPRAEALSQAGAR
jgi:hypothetical protein